MGKTESKVYLQRLREMSGEQRLKIAADLSSTVLQIAKTAIANEHPEWSSSQIQRELLRRLYGSDISSQICRRATQ